MDGMGFSMVWVDFGWMGWRFRRLFWSFGYGVEFSAVRVGRWGVDDSGGSFVYHVGLVVGVDFFDREGGGGVSMPVVMSELVGRQWLCGGMVFYWWL